MKRSARSTQLSVHAALIVVGVLSILLALGSPVCAQMVTGRNMTDFAKVFRLPGGPPPASCAVQGVTSTTPGNILCPGDKLTTAITLANSTDSAVEAVGQLAVIPYGTEGKPGDLWVPTVIPRGPARTLPITVHVAPHATALLNFSPPVPARFGAYGIVLDLGPKLGRQFVLSCVRTFKPDGAAVQYPSLSLDNLGPDVLARLGVHAIRWGVSYKPTTDRDFEQWYAVQGRKLKALHAAGVTVLMMTGGGEYFDSTQPLGRPRPWLDATGTMRDTKFDLAWLPTYDADFAKFIERFCGDYGWPKGPVTACSLWNEPWEGISISGWGADMLRYREMYTKMVDGVHRASRVQGVEVLVGGCDSSSNALDKLFCDGTNRFLADFDFLSVHYQGMNSFATYKPWVDRKSPRGRVRIWDTESWVANTDDRVAAVMAANRSAGYDRAMGVYGGNIHDGVNAWSPAAAVGAAQHFLGDRQFNRLLFTNGLPWVMEFHGLHSNAEDGTVIVVGDLGEEFGADNLLYRTARGLREVAHKEALRKKVATLTSSQASVLDTGIANAPSRTIPLTVGQALPQQAAEPETLSGATMTLSAMGGIVRAYDSYGNAVTAPGNKIVIPLDGRGFFLRGNGSHGAFAMLLHAIRNSLLMGIEPLAVCAHDILSPLSARPELRLTLTNVLNKPVRGLLHVQLGSIRLRKAIRSLAFLPNETKQVRLQVSGGKPVLSNSYPLEVRFDAGPDGTTIHNEDMHVNVIARRTIRVDGKLDDWAGVLPQTVVRDSGAPTITEAAWYPFKPFESGTGNGVATGYVAYDKEYFYFAAKVADSTPDGGTLRFATRDDDSFFYPQVSYVTRIDHPSVAPRMGSDTATAHELTWPAGVRRYSYRENPILPCGNFPNFDNVQIAFNVLPQAQKRYYLNPTGTPPDYTIASDSDYEFALNKVAARHGGGTEIWRLAAPGLPLKHYYPRQPKAAGEGPVSTGKLVVIQGETTRIEEAAIPWSEIPAVRAAMLAARPIKFSFRINDNAGVGCLELARGRSVAKRGGSFHADWVEHWENQVEFGWGK